MAHMDLKDFLVQEFSGSGPESYGRLPMSRKRDLQRHLNNILIRAPKKILPIFEEDTGIKLHFNVTRGADGWDVIPNETFMKKMAFLADKTLITFPFHDVDYSKDEDLQCLLSLIEGVSPFLKNDIFYILPSVDLTDGTCLTSESFREELGLISANFSQKMLLRQFKEDLANEDNIYQPKFGEITVADILEVRVQNEERFRYMQKYLAHDFTMEQETQRRLVFELQRIDLRVKELNDKFNNLKSTYRIESFLSLGKLVANVLPYLAQVCPPVALIVRFMTEGKPLEGIGKAAKDIWMHRLDAQTFMNQDFYLYWRIKNPKTTL